MYAVFVQSNDPAANVVVAYGRDEAGHLREAGQYGTGGVGAAVEGGAVGDRPRRSPLASQGALTYDPVHRLLYAVNAGSDTVTVFSVDGTRLDGRQILPSGGHLPVSVGVAKDLVYVLDAGGDGAITGFRVRDGRLEPVADSTRGLGLGNADTPNFITAPSQVIITPDAAHVIVATKSHNRLDVFPLDSAGRPAARAVPTPSEGRVPFALSFDLGGRLLVAEVGGTQSSYEVTADGHLKTISGAVPNNGQLAPCWSVVVGDHVYVANTGSETITAFRVAPDGSLTLGHPSGVAASTSLGPIDLAASSDNRFLYLQAGGAGAIDEFAVGRDGSLTRIGQVTGLPPFDGSKGPEGIAAT